MSEKLKTSPEQRVEALPALPAPEQAEKLRPGEKDPRLALHEARETVAETVRVETGPNPLEALAAAEKASDPATPRQINRELKQITLRRELQSIRRQLSAPQRTLSRVIHQPAVRVVSEAAGNTVSRPSGLLGGGLVAFFGTSGYLYLAKHIGFTYNYFVFFLLLVGGFAVGLALEFMVYLATASRRRHD